MERVISLCYNGAFEMQMKGLQSTLFSTKYWHHTPIDSPPNGTKRLFLFDELFVGGYANGDMHGFEALSSLDMDLIIGIAKKYDCTIAFGYSEWADEDGLKV